MDTDQDPGLEYQQGKDLRDNIAKDMWDQYDLESNMLTDCPIDV